MASERILSVISISKKYKTRPSEVIGISDTYTAFCFDEACLYILSMIEDGKEPVFKKKDKQKELKQKYSKPSDMYKDMGYGSGYVKVND